jgi:hypothetical protein
MNKEKQILEYVKNYATVERWTQKKGVIKVLFASVRYPEDGEFYSQEIYAHPKKDEKEIVKELFNLLSKEIIDEMSEKKEPVWIKKIIYKPCPEMICGDNPCSCKDG